MCVTCITVSMCSLHSFLTLTAFVLLFEVVFVLAQKFLPEQEDILNSSCVLFYFLDSRIQEEEKKKRKFSFRVIFFLPFFHQKQVWLIFLQEFFFPITAYNTCEVLVLGIFFICTQVSFHEHSSSFSRVSVLSLSITQLELMKSTTIL